MIISHDLEYTKYLIFSLLQSDIISVMAKNLIMKVGGNKYVNHSFFRPYLYIYDDAVVYTKRKKIFFLDEITMSYNHIVRVVLHQGMVFSKLEIVMSGGEHSVLTKGLWNRPARKVKKLIDEKIFHVHNKPHHHEMYEGRETPSMENFERSLHRLRELRHQDKLSKKEYEKKKMELLKEL